MPKPGQSDLLYASKSPAVTKWALMDIFKPLYPRTLGRYRGPTNVVLLLLLGRVALGAQRPIVVELAGGRSVGRSVRLSSALWKNGGSDPDAV